MASETELLGAIKELLHNDGNLNKIQALVRSLVTESLHKHQNSLDGDISKNVPPKPSEEVALVNELIREYLDWNGYFYTSSVLTKETGLPSEKRSRSALCTEVGVKDDERSATLPLLFNIVAAYTDRVHRKLSKCKREHHQE